MRRLVVLVTVLALAVPVAAVGSVRSPGDGTLSVTKVDGSVRIKGKGAIIGRCDRCVLRIDDVRESDPIRPFVTRPNGVQRGVDLDGDGDADRFVGTNLRWKIIGGSFEVQVAQGTGVGISFVGRGWVRVAGTAGTYFVNGSDPQPVTTDGTMFLLRASTTP